MKIKVLGTGAVSAVELSPGYLIDGNILVDVPSGCWKLIESLGHPRMGVEDILITHFHADHYFDIPYAFITRMGKTEVPLTIYCGKSGPDRIDSLLKLAYEDFYNKMKTVPVNYINDDNFKVKNYKVKRYPVNHKGICDCYTYVFDDGEKRVGFSGDTCLCDGLVKAIEGCSHFICECSKPDPVTEKPESNHMRVKDLESLARQFPGCTFYATHMTTASRAQLEERKIRNVVVLKDLDELEF